MSITVFLADDHAVLREGLKLLLESQEDIIVSGNAANGRDAVRQTIKLRPDVIIMDISMPELNGIDATYQILEVCPSTRIIILSMHAASEHILRALKAGARGYLLKESAGKEIIQAVRTVYGGGRYLSLKISDNLIDNYLQRYGDNDIDNPLSRLSPREKEIMQLVAEGKSSIEIANIIFLSPKTVETYRSRLMQKLNVRDITGLIKIALKHDLIPLE
ncbi:MAG: response regulator transcription factor [Proteobacteria bacterium]|nr:response regulator transcription factor [Pseudomonadota bacterium]